MRSSTHIRSRAQAPRRARLALEALEGRALPSTFTVSNLLDNTDPGSLRWAVGQANSNPGPDTVVFASGVSGTLALTGGELLITDSVTINGPGASLLTVSGNNASRVFDVSNSATVTLAGLTIANGSVTGHDDTGTPITSYGGGGILNQAGSTLTLNQDTLSNNTATAASTSVDVFGGCLLNEGRATVTSCTFSSNEATGGGGPSFFGGSEGGAIDNFGGAILSVADSTFTANQALGASSGGAANNFGIGGAIENNAGLQTVSNGVLLTQPATPSMATISNCTFTGNMASGGAGVLGNGGALDNEGTGATMTVSGSTFNNNQSVGGDGAGSIGGAIMNLADSTLTVTNSSFSGNEALGGGSGTSGGGGAIVNDGGDFSSATTTATISNCTFTGNMAGGVVGVANVSANGGAIVNAGPFGLMTVNNSTLMDNQAVGQSGVNGVGGVGGAINNFSGATLSVTSSSFIGNQALGASSGSAGIGGAIDSEPQYGGTPSLAVKATITNCTFSGNVAGASTGVSGVTGFGGALANQGKGTSATMTVSDSTLSANSAQTNGGGIANQTGGSVTLNNTIAANSTSGGDLFLDSGNGSIFTGSHDLIGDGSDLGSLTSSLQGNPLLAALGNYGGSAQTLALLPGSPAINAGSSALAAGLSTDQRGSPRIAGSVVDIGALESQGFKITASSGNHQSADEGTSFANPLTVTVTANNAGEPVNGGVVTFTAPPSGSSAILSAHTATITAGTASVTATANPHSWLVHGHGNHLRRQHTGQLLPDRDRPEEADRHQPPSSVGQHVGVRPGGVVHGGGERHRRRGAPGDRRHGDVPGGRERLGHSRAQH
jgi:hypothetical protein